MARVCLPKTVCSAPGWGHLVLPPAQFPLQCLGSASPVTNHTSLLNSAAGSQAEPNKSTWLLLRGGFGLRAGFGKGVAAGTGMGSQSWGLSRAVLGAAKAGEACPGGGYFYKWWSWVMLFPEGG